MVRGRRGSFVMPLVRRWWQRQQRTATATATATGKWARQDWRAVEQPSPVAVSPCRLRCCSAEREVWACGPCGPCGPCPESI